MINLNEIRCVDNRELSRDEIGRLANDEAAAEIPDAE